MPWYRPSNMPFTSVDRDKAAGVAHNGHGHDGPTLDRDRGSKGGTRSIRTHSEQEQAEKSIS